MVRMAKRDTIFTTLFFLMIFIMVMLSVPLKNLECARMLFSWLILYLLIYFAKLIHSATNLGLIKKANYKPDKMNNIQYLILNPLHGACLVYGNLVFFVFDHKSDCGDTAIYLVERLHTFVLVLLILGFL